MKYKFYINTARNTLYRVSYKTEYLHLNVEPRIWQTYMGWWCKNPTTIKELVKISREEAFLLLL